MDKKGGCGQLAVGKQPLTSLSRCSPSLITTIRNVLYRCPIISRIARLQPRSVKTKDAKEGTAQALWAVISSWVGSQPADCGGLAVQQRIVKSVDWLPQLEVRALVVSALDDEAIRSTGHGVVRAAGGTHAFDRRLDVVHSEAQLDFRCRVFR